MRNIIGWTHTDLDDSVKFCEPSQNQEQNPVLTRKKFYMCKHMKRKKYCRYGDACKFAHSKQELWFPTHKLYERKKVHLRPIPPSSQLVQLSDC